MKRFSLLLAMGCVSSLLLRADTIYQINAVGRRVVVQRDAILVSEDSSSLVYKHFDLKERRVTKVRLNKGSLPYTVERGGADDRQRIVEIWKRFGHKVLATDQAGKTTRVFDAYLDFYPPGGRGSLLESVPARTTFPVELDTQGADEIEFSEIDRIEFQDDRLRVTLRKGQTLMGRFFMPAGQPAEARLLGVTENYDPAGPEVYDFSLPLTRLKEIRFEQ